MKVHSLDRKTWTVHLDSVDVHGVLKRYVAKWLSSWNPSLQNLRFSGITLSLGGYDVTFTERAAEEPIPIPDFLRRTPKDAQPISLTEHYYRLSQLAAQREAGHG